METFRHQVFRWTENLDKTVQTATFHFLKHKFYSYDSVTKALLLYNYNYHSKHYLTNILINYVISLAKCLYILFRLIEAFFPFRSKNIHIL